MSFISVMFQRQVHIMKRDVGESTADDECGLYAIVMFILSHGNVHETRWFSTAN